MKIRVIPTLLWKEFGLVKGVRFNSWRRVGTVLPAIKVYNHRDVDELALFDISTDLGSGRLDIEALEDLSSDCFVPLTVGGGVHSAEDVNRLLRAGADKISVNSALYSNPALVSDIAKIFGSQCVVASIDVLFDHRSNNWECFSDCGSTPTGRHPVDWAKELEGRGAGEILLTSIDRDGTFSGYDLGLVESVASSVSVPVIASGGAGCYDDMVKVVKDAGASAVAAASIFHFTELTPSGARSALADAGIPVRNTF
jgi:cyclase